MNAAALELPVYEPAPLTDRPIPPRSYGQLGNFTMRSIRAAQGGMFEVALPEGQTVLAIDMGGDSISAAERSVRDGQLVKGNNWFDIKGVKAGKGYLGHLMQAARYAEERGIPAGISFAGPMDGTRPLGGENVRTFMRELHDGYDGDLAKIFKPSSSTDAENDTSLLVDADNDARAGLKSARLHVAKLLPGVKKIIFAINGSGANAAAWINGMTWTMEAAHVPVAEELNSLDQQEKCSLFENDFVCLERIIGGKAGIESQWEQQTGEALSGRAIENRWRKGSRLAANLYDNAALGTALMIQGVARTLHANLSDGSTAIVGHGGTFRFPGIGDRITQIISAHAGGESPLLLTHDLSDNACLDGAALGALAKIAVRA